MRLLAAAVLFLYVSASSLFGETGTGLKKVLTSVAQNIHLDDWEYETQGADGRKVRVVKSTLHGGKQEGVDIITVDNGKLQIVIVPTRGMSVLGVSMGDVRLGWDSPVREVVHPSHINLHDRNGLGWLDGFNEWMVRCGLEFAGHPGLDKFTDNTGAAATQKLTLHGKIGNIPASEVEVLIDARAPGRIRVRGRVDERTVYGAAMEIWTEISTLPGSESFRIDDEIANRGAGEQEFELIYHCNYGPPLLEKGARLTVPVRRITPMNEAAAKAIDQYATFTAPTPGATEQVFLIDPLTDLEGKVTAMLTDAGSMRGTTIRFSTTQLPYLTIWKNMAPLRAGYVTGIEPGTNFPFNRRVERHFGRLSTLAPDQTRKFSLEYRILASPEEIQQMAAAIRTVQEDWQPEIVREVPDISSIED